MALWGKTDALASVPKYIARTATVAAAKIDASADTIDISGANTGLNTGDQVAYLGDATTEGNYFVRVVSAGVVSLYSTAAQAAAGGATGKANLSAGSGNHSLQATGVQGNITAGGQQIIFVDAQEATVAANKAKGITGAGWWRFITYTDAQSATRNKAECLIAMAVSSAAAGDAEDTITVDRAITISAQPGNASVVAPATATFSVTATATGVGDLTYQWQIQQEGAGAWANISGATAASYTTGATATGDGAGATDGDKYRVVISTAGAADATSNAATLTVTAE